jgi:broad specificity phosphatase PhoE
MQMLFARHGESQANLLHEISNRGLKHGLTRKGRQQALTLAERLTGRGISRIYTSPLLRALETAALVANRLDLEFEVTGALREFDCGVAEGRSDPEAWQLWQSVFDAWTVRNEWEASIQGGESLRDLQERFVPFIESLTDRFAGSGETVLCVSHGGVYWMMLPLVLANVDTQFIHARRGFDYTACIAAELRQGRLWCTEWNGTRLPEEKRT